MSDTHLLSLALIDVGDRQAPLWIAGPPPWCSARSPLEVLEEAELPTHLLDPGPPARIPFSNSRYAALVIRDSERRCVLISPLSSTPEEARRAFFASFSHELRTPLNAILGFSKLLQLEKPGELNERQREFVVHVLTAAEQLLAIVNRGLDETKSRLRP